MKIIGIKLNIMIILVCLDFKFILILLKLIIVLEKDITVIVPQYKTLSFFDFFLV